MSTHRTRIGVVGAGAVTRQLSIPNLRAVPGVEVAALCNATIESAQRVAAELGIPEVEPDWQSMVLRDDLDAIWIGTPPVLHAPVAIAALESGKHVFCQARMAMDLAEARAMLAAAERHPEQVAMLSPPPSGMRSGRLMERLLNESYVGERTHFRLVAESDMFSDPTAPAHWRQRRDVSGLNVLTLGIYAEVVHRWLGPPTEVFARTRVCIPRRGDDEVLVPDVVHVSGTWGDGILGTLELSGIALHPPPSTLTVHGNDGTLEYCFDTDVVRGARRGDAGLRALDLPPELTTEWRVERDFVDALRTGSRPEPGFATGVAYMEFTEAVHRSAATGRSVRIPLPT